MNNHIILFGIGYWGKNHLRELSKNNSVHKLYVVDPMISSYPDLTMQYSDVDFFKSFADFKDKNLHANAAVIATPPHTHFEIAKNCLLNDIHILVEKPMVEKNVSFRGVKKYR